MGAATFLQYVLLIGTSIWVLCDAKAIGVKKGQVKGIANMGPWGWFFACLLLWIICFPWYLVKRSEYLRVNEKQPNPLVTRVGFGAYAVALIVVALVIAGSLRLGTGDLQQEVQANIAETFAKDPDTAGVKVRSLQLVHRSGNQYNGLLEVSSGGQSAQLSVDVTYDGNSFMWRIQR
jgi:hypothetical protein